jgi:hypothetical protein
VTPPFTDLLPDAPAAHAALKAARELVRGGDVAAALDVLDRPAGRDTPLARLLRADLLLAVGRPGPALELALEVSRQHGDTGQGLLCAGHAALALGDRPAAAGLFARAALADPGRIAARVNAAFFPCSLPPAAGRDRPALAAAPDGSAAPTNAATAADTAEAAGSAKAAVAVTSLPPGAGDRSRKAVASWAAAGFEAIVSVNTAEEIAALTGLFPEVAFVAAASPAQAAFGRAYAGLPRLLEAGLAAGAPTVAVLNADIVLAARPDFAARLTTAAAGGAVIACRTDRGPDQPGTATYYDVGFDLCAVDARYGRRPELEGFFLGLPWWDYALPLAVARAGGGLRFCPAPLLIHTVHDTAWSHRAFVALGRLFASRFWPQLEFELFGRDERAMDGGPEALLAALGGRTAATLRRAPDAGLWDRTGFCPHDAAFAAALLPLTKILPGR